jgi:hypothetical protein
MVAEATADRHANELMVTLETASWPLGTYVRMICEQLDAHGRAHDRSVVVVGRRTQSQRAWTPMLLHLIPGTSRLRLTFENAFYDHIVPLHGLQVSLLNSASRGGCPLGSVGLIAADPGEFAALVREMVDHYPHYAATAAQFAAQWNRKHDPSQTIVQLVERAQSQPQQRRAAA